MRHLVLSVFFASSLLACGGGADLSSPKGVANSLAAAASSGDPSAAVALLPPVDQLEAHFACEGERTLVSRRNKRAERAAKEFGGERMKGVTMTIAAFDSEGSETTTIKTGETWEDCKALKDVELHESRLTLKIEKDGKAKDDGETWRFIKLAGNWYFAKL